MALTLTTLAAAIDANTLDFNVTAATGATVGGFVRIDGEFSYIVAIAGNKISVRMRGDNGGTAVSHGVLAPVTFGLNSDLATLGVTETIPVPIDRENLVSIGADGVIAVPNRDTLFLITKGAALASSTFANPSGSQDGLQATFVGSTDFAHVVTTVAVHDGTTGAHTTLTSPAFAGGSLTLVASKGRWLVRANNLWVIT